MKNIDKIIPETFEEASQSTDPRIETVVMNSILIGIITVLIDKGITTPKELDTIVEDAYARSCFLGLSEYLKQKRGYKLKC